MGGPAASSGFVMMSHRVSVCAPAKQWGYSGHSFRPQVALRKWGLCFQHKAGTSAKLSLQVGSCAREWMEVKAPHSASDGFSLECDADTWLRNFILRAACWVRDWEPLGASRKASWRRPPCVIQAVQCRQALGASKLRGRCPFPKRTSLAATW